MRAAYKAQPPGHVGELSNLDCAVRAGRISLAGFFVHFQGTAVVQVFFSLRADLATYVVEPSSVKQILKDGDGR